MNRKSVIGLCGSLRKDSFNRRALAHAAQHLGDDVDYTEITLNWPLYDGDLEAANGVPQAILIAAEAIANADAVIIAAPEYNKGITGVLKNALDWLSRTPSKPFANKPVAVISAAAGRTGGETAQFMTKACLIPLGAHLITTPSVLIAGAHAEFDENGLTNERYAAALAEVATTIKAAIA